MISYPIITRIQRRYIDGARYSDIKIQEDGVISDGHHRFISLSLLHADVKTVLAGQNSTKRISLEWKEVLLDDTDHDSSWMKLKYRKQYDEG